MILVHEEQKTYSRYVKVGVEEGEMVGGIRQGFSIRKNIKFAEKVEKRKIGV